MLLFLTFTKAVLIFNDRSILIDLIDILFTFNCRIF